MNFRELNKLLGNIDIYLLDQILKGRFGDKTTVLDAGCGEGRNLIYLVNQGYDVYGYDKNPTALQMLAFQLKQINPAFDQRKLIEGDTEKLPLPNSFFDVVISSAVLHFAESEQNFWKQLGELNRVMGREAILFIRMTSNIGLSENLRDAGNGRFFIPDGSLRFLLTKEHIEQMKSMFKWKAIEPVKTTNVEDLRCMTTLVFQKP